MSFHKGDIVPVSTDSRCVQDAVIADLKGLVSDFYIGLGPVVAQDMETRKQVGIERYGTVLRPFNGRDASQDAYEECLDLVNYLMQCRMEREDRDLWRVLYNMARFLATAIKAEQLAHDSRLL